jgi:hypothetical protein
MSSNQKKSIVIVGGGSKALFLLRRAFRADGSVHSGAGVTLAALLEKSVTTQLPDYQVILITGKEYHYHLIAGLRANTSDTDLAEKIAIPYDKLFKDSTLHKIITKKVKEVKKDSVVLEDGTDIPFAYCVVATGKKWMAPNECVRLWQSFKFHFAEYDPPAAFPTPVKKLSTT